MVEMRQPFYSILSAFIFADLGLLFVIAATNEWAIQLGSVIVNTPTAMALSGLMFLMSYFALAHMMHR